MRTLKPKHERAFDDLRSALEDSDDAEWPDTVEDAVNDFWDRLLEIGDPNEPE